ncbi:hypothetical protein ATANTOWER_015042 [Ataeniobius toweri]|uniref:Uncharacterized protein n=1 Tax=Ataeniobius toweri TaxID=208326 RepID=A0ABU7C0E0_9TELE|nr:hypothetical protein [Ataeniobius toweri]
MTRLCPEAPQHSASLAPGPHPAASMGPRSPRLCLSHYRCPFRSHCLCPAASVMPCDPLEENRLCVSAAGAAGYLWKQTPLNHFPLHPAAESVCVCVGEALSFTSLFAPTEAVCLFLAAAVCPKLVRLETSNMNNIRSQSTSTAVLTHFRGRYADFHSFRAQPEPNCDPHYYQTVHSDSVYCSNWLRI